MTELEIKKIEDMKKVIDQNIYTYFKDYYKGHGRFYYDDIKEFFEKHNLEVTKKYFEDTFISKMKLVNYTLAILKEIERKTKKKMFAY